MNIMASISDYPWQIWVYGFVAVAVAFFTIKLLFWIFQLTARQKDSFLGKAFAEQLQWPTIWAICIILIHSLMAYFLPESSKIRSYSGRTLTIFLIADFSWILVKLTYILSDYILHRYDISSADNLQARKMHTQLKVFRRIMACLIFFIGAACILMTFPNVRQLGTSLMASAGVIGIIAGFAAQQTIHTFFTGIQIALTQPIRLDDVVIVEGEWGRIEEITLTYVVVRIWDLRRLIVPITYFIEKPFQNWTRISADILGTVFLYVDYTVPVEAIRQELKHIVEESELWDQKVCALQVTNAKEESLELRALVSAADASSAWTLRCYVREKLVAFVQKEYPQALPRVRAEFRQIAADTHPN